MYNHQDYIETPSFEDPVLNSVMQKRIAHQNKNIRPQAGLNRAAIKKYQAGVKEHGDKGLADSGLGIKETLYNAWEESTDKLNYYEHLLSIMDEGADKSTITFLQSNEFITESAIWRLYEEYSD